MALALLQEADRRVKHKGKLATVWARNLQIITLSAAGVSDVDIAAQLDITPQTVRNTMNSGLMQALACVALDRSLEDAIDVHNRIKEAAPLAIQLLTDSMQSPTVGDNLKVKIAQDMLDRAGHPRQTLIGSNNPTPFTDDVISELKKYGNQIRMRSRVVELSIDETTTTFKNGTKNETTTNSDNTPLVHVGEATVVSD